jgi:hypothetical protein
MIYLIGQLYFEKSRFALVISDNPFGVHQSSSSHLDDVFPGIAGGNLICKINEILCSLLTMY